jgi:hypothetical protein
MGKQDGVDELFEGGTSTARLLFCACAGIFAGKRCRWYLLHQSLHTRLHNALNHQERQASEDERQPDMTGILAPGAMETRYGTTPMLH